MSFLSVPQFAARLGIDQRTVRDQIRAGKIAAAKVGRDWLIDELEEGAYRATSLGRPGRRAAAPGSARKRRSGT